MDCNAIQERMSAYLERDLPDEERRAFETHLETCAACRREIGLFRQTLRALAATAAATPMVPATFESRLRRRIGNRAPGGARAGLPGGWKGLALAASVALAFGLGFLVRGVVPGGGREPSVADLSIPVSGTLLDEVQRNGYAIVRPASAGGQELIVADPRLLTDSLRRSPSGRRLATLPDRPPFAGIQPEEIYVGGDGDTGVYLRTSPVADSADGTDPSAAVLPAVVKQTF